MPQRSPDDDAAAEEDEDDPLSESRAALAEAFSGAEIAYLLTHLVPTMNSSSSAGGALGENCSSSSNDSSSAASVASTVMSSLLSIASHLPPETVQSEGLKQHLMERLTAMRPPHRTQVEFGSSTDAASAPHCSVNSGGSGVDMQLLLHCLCSWGGGDDVLAAATAALRTATALTVAAPSAPVAAGEGAPQRPISMDPLVAIAAMTGVLALAAVPGGGVAVGQEALFDAMASLAEATQCLSGSLRAAIAIVDSSASAGSAAVGGGALSPDLADAPAEASAAADAAVLPRGAQAGTLAATASVGWCRLLLRGVCIMTKAGAPAFATSFARSAVATMGGWARRELLPAAVIGADVLARSMFVGSGGGGGTSVFAAEGSGGSAGDEDAFEGVEGDDIALTGPTATTTTMSSQGSCGALPPPTASTTSRSSSSGTRTTAAPLVLRHLLTSAGVVTGAIASALSDLVLLGLGDIGPSVALELFSDFTSGDALNAPTPPPAAAVGGTTQRQQRNNEDVEEEEVGSANSSSAWLFTSTTPVDWLVAPSGAQGRGGGAAKGSSGGSSSNDLGQSDVASGALLRLGLRLHAAACASPTAAAHNPQQHQQQFAVGARIRLWRGLARLMVAMGAEAQASDDDAAVASALRRGGSGGTHSSGSSDETYVVPQRQQQGDDDDDASSQSGSSKATSTAAAAPSVPRMRSILYESWETALSASAGGSSSSSSGPLMQLQDMLGAMLPELEAAVSPTSPALTAAAAAQPSDATAAPATGASKKKKAAAAAAAAAASPEGLQCHALSTLIRATVAAGGALDGVSSGRALGQVLAHRLYVLQRIAKEEAETVGGVAGERRQHHHRRQGSRAALAMDEEEADDDHEDDDGDAIGGAAAAGTPSPGTLASIATVRAIGAAYCSVAPSKPAKEVAAAIAAMLDCGAQ